VTADAPTTGRITEGHPIGSDGGLLDGMLDEDRVARPRPVSAKGYRRSWRASPGRRRLRSNSASVPCHRLDRYLNFSTKAGYHFDGRHLLRRQPQQELHPLPLPEGRPTRSSPAAGALHHARARGPRLGSMRKATSSTRGSTSTGEVIQQHLADPAG
jgi:hypothetical protein